MSRIYRSSKPSHWVQPRPHSDASSRMQVYGPVEPMEYDTVLDWIVAKLRRPVIRFLRWKRQR